MDPLSIAASTVGFVSAVADAIKYLESVRHYKEDARDFVESFEHIKSDLESFGKLLKAIHDFKALPSLSPSIASVHQRHGLQFARAKAMGEPGAEYDILAGKIDDLCNKFKPEEKSKLKRFKTSATWILQKERIKEEQSKVRKHLEHMRNRLLDDQAEEQLEDRRIWRKLEYNEDVRNHIEILDWLSADALDVPLYAADDLDLDSTSFVQSNDMYTQWHHDRVWQMACYGRPGSGKSFRAQAVTRDLHRRYDAHAIPVLSLFFDEKSAARQSVRSVLCSLLRQLITSQKPIAIPNSLLAAWEGAKFQSRAPLNEKKARELLRQELAQYEPKFLVVDALDEAEGCDTIDAEIKWLRNAGVCILSTSVHEPRALNEYALCFRHQVTVGGGPWEPLPVYWRCDVCKGPFGKGIEICHDCLVNKQLTCEDDTHVLRPPGRLHFEVYSTSKDIESYAKHFLSDAAASGDTGDDDYMFSGNMSVLATVRHDIGDHIWSSLPGKVADAVDGNFLHAKLTLESLSVQRNADGAKSVIAQIEHHSLPAINQQYQAKLERCLRGHGAKVARGHLSIVAVAVEVLHFDQLAHAAAICAGDHSIADFADRITAKELVRGDTIGLLAIEPSRDSDKFVAGFPNKALSTYVSEHPDETLPDAQQRMLDACLSYLQLDIFAKAFATSAQLNDALEQYPFVNYAACYWGLHARQAKPTVANATRVLQLLSDTDRFACVMQVAWRAPSIAEVAWDVTGGITPLHACAFFGLDSIIVAIIDFTSNVDVGEETYLQTPLAYACRQGHVEVVRQLLKAGAKVNHLSKRGWTPLLEAIGSDHCDIFDLLLTHDGIDVNLKGSGKSDRTPLMLAAETGQTAMVEKLLARNKIMVNEVDGWNCTALSRAVQSLSIPCIRLLLDHKDTDLSIRDSADGRNALD